MGKKSRTRKKSGKKPRASKKAGGPRKGGASRKGRGSRKPRASKKAGGPRKREMPRNVKGRVASVVWTSLENIPAPLRAPDPSARLGVVREVADRVAAGKKVDPDSSLLYFALADDDEEVRWLAADTLTSRWTRDWHYATYKKSLSMLRSPERSERIKGAEWLINITTPDMVSDRDEREIGFALPSLVACSLDPDPKVAESCVQAISCAMEEDDVSLALPTLVKILACASDSVRKVASLVIRGMMMAREPYLVDQFLPDLQRYLDDPHEPVKFAVADALSYYLAKRKEWGVVKVLLAHPDKNVRQEAVGTLHELYNKELSPVVPVLAEMIGDDSEDEDVKLVAARTLIRGCRSVHDLEVAMPVVTRALSHPKEDNRVYAANLVHDVIDRLKGFQEDLREKSGKRGRPPLKRRSDISWNVITDNLGAIEAGYGDPSAKVRGYLARYMVDYYLQAGRGERIVEILREAEAGVRDQVKKWLEYSEHAGSKLPEVVLSYLARDDRKNLARRFRKLASSGKKQLSLSGQSLGSISIVELPPEIGLLQNLTRLDLGGNSLTSLPAEIGKLVNLKTLVATNNKLAELPPTFGNLGALEVAFLYRNQLETLPTEIGKLKRLRHLQLTQNKLKSLPPEIGDLVGLVHLDIQENRLTGFPPEFCNLENLEHLDATANRIRALPSCFGNLANLNHLLLGRNEMKEVPPQIFELRQLRYFNFSKNGVKELSPQIARLGALETLELYGNKLKFLPPEIGALKSLMYLNLSNNQLEELPAEILLGSGVVRSIHFPHLLDQLWFKARDLPDFHRHITSSFAVIGFPHRFFPLHLVHPPDGTGRCGNPGFTSRILFVELLVTF
ncbi:MAG: leucine-rich repeat domain-containing protein [Promethearchaeota archaeon]